MLGETWEHQYKRMRREYEQLERVVDQYVDRNPEIHDEANSRHALFDFFVNAFHLKDYIKNQPGHPTAIERAVEKLFDLSHPHHSTALVICADIANTVKHYSLDRPRFNPPATISAQRAGISVPHTVPAHFTYHFTIEADGRTYSEIQVADDAIADWDAWLSRHGFLLPP